MSLENGAVDKTIPIPLYYQLKTLILGEILTGNMKPGDMLPPETELQKRFGLSNTTVRQAMKELVMEGYVYRVKSKGTFIADPRIPQLSLSKLGSFREEMEAQGFVPGIKVLTREVIAAPQHVAEMLRVPDKSRVFHSASIRYANNEPVLTEDMYLRLDWVDPDKFDIAKEKFYSLLAQNPNTRMSRSERTIESRLATEVDHELLKVPIGFPIQDVTLLDFNMESLPYLYAVLSYRGDKNKFKVVLLAES